MAARRNEPVKETPEEPKEEPVVTRSGDAVEVDLSEPEADDDEPEEPQLSRREKKAQRQSLREQAEADREARLAAEQRAAYALGVAQTTIQQSQQRQQFKAPHEIEADSIFKERELLVQEFNLARQRNKGDLTPEQEQDFKRRGYNLISILGLEPMLNYLMAKGLIEEAQYAASMEYIERRRSERTG